MLNWYYTLSNGTLDRKRLSCIANYTLQITTHLLFTMPAIREMELLQKYGISLCENNLTRKVGKNYLVGGQYMVNRKLLQVILI